MGAGSLAGSGSPGASGSGRGGSGAGSVSGSGDGCTCPLASESGGCSPGNPSVVADASGGGSTGAPAWPSSRFSAWPSSSGPADFSAGSAFGLRRASNTARPRAMTSSDSWSDEILAFWPGYPPGVNNLLKVSRKSLFRIARRSPGNITRGGVCGPHLFAGEIAPPARRSVGARRPRWGVQRSTRAPDPTRPGQPRPSAEVPPAVQRSRPPPAGPERAPRTRRLRLPGPRRGRSPGSSWRGAPGLAPPPPPGKQPPKPGFPNPGRGQPR